MSKSNLQKNATKTIVTNLTIGWEDATVLAANTSETGFPIYVVPRKAEVMFQRMLWTVILGQNPTLSVTMRYAIYNRQPNVTFGDNNRSFAQNALMLVTQSWENLTSVGVVNTAQTQEVNMKELTLSRASNLQDDDEYTIAPAYRADQNVTGGQTGTLYLKESLFQENFRDSADEWSGYTYEESAS